MASLLVALAASCVSIIFCWSGVPGRMLASWAGVSSEYPYTGRWRILISSLYFHWFRLQDQRYSAEQGSMTSTSDIIRFLPQCLFMTSITRQIEIRHTPFRNISHLYAHMN